MGFFRRLLGSSDTGPDESTPVRPTRPDEVVDARTPAPSGGVMLSGGSGRIHAVGESNYRDAIRAATGGPHPDGVSILLTVELVAEPDNRYDANAVSVRVDGATVAYLGREDAAEFRPLLDRLGQSESRAYCEAFVGWGWERSQRDRGHYSVVLHLDPPTEQLRILDYVPTEDRSYASSSCPYCGSVFDPLPKAKTKCRACGEAVFVRSGPDSRRYLLRDEDLPKMEAAWTAHHEGRATQVADLLTALPGGSSRGA